MNGIFFDSPGGTVSGPSVSMVNPADGASVAGSVNLSAQAQGSSPIQSVQFLLDNNSLNAPVTGPGPAFSTSWDSTEVSNGVHMLAASATDTAGHSVTSTPITVTIANGTVSGDTSATFIKVDATTFGNWKGVYGSAGSIIANDSSHVPAYASVNVNGIPTWIWQQSVNGARALLKYGSTTDHIASTFYNSPDFSIDVNFTDGQAHQVAVYVIDWDGGNRSQKIEILDAASNAVLDSRTVNNFGVQGRYLVWTVRGHVLIHAVKQTGANAIINGILFD